MIHSYMSRSMPKSVVAIDFLRRSTLIRTIHPGLFFLFIILIDFTENNGPSNLM